VVHNAAFPPESADRQAAAYHFAEAGEVWDDAADFLISAARDAEAGHDFVEDERRVIFGGDGAEEFEKPRIGR
jgi:hypothetical protein